MGGIATGSTGSFSQGGAVIPPPGSVHYYCNICGKVFNHSSNVIRHKRSVHMGWNTCSCSVCGKCFRDNSTLKRHVKQMHGIPTYNAPKLA